MMLSVPHSKVGSLKAPTSSSRVAALCLSLSTLISFVGGPVAAAPPDSRQRPAVGALPAAPPAAPPRYAVPPKAPEAPLAPKAPPVGITDAVPPETSVNPDVTPVPIYAPVAIRYEPVVLPRPVFPVDRMPIFWADVQAPLATTPFSETPAIIEPSETQPARASRESMQSDVRRVLFSRGPYDASIVVAAWNDTAAPGGDVAEPAAIIRALIETERDPRKLDGLSGRLGDESPWAVLARAQLTLRACRGWYHSLCLAAVERLAASQGHPAFASVGGRDVPVVALTAVRSRAIGVLLPLTGSFGHIGQGAERALRLAFEGVAGLELVVRDTGGDAAMAAKMAESLIFDDHVVALIGPVGRAEVSSAVAVSRSLGVPHIVLASRLELDDLDRVAAGPTDGGVVDAAQLVAVVEPARDTAIRVRTSPEEIARAVARHAVLELRLARFGVFRPDDANSAAIADAFRDEAQRLGAAVTDEGTYDPESKNFNKEIEAFLKPSRDAMPKSRRRNRAKAVDARFEGLFIPDGAPRVRRLVPFLEFGGLTLRQQPGQSGVQLLGASGWNQQTLIDVANAVTNNAIFADAWFDGGEDPRSESFSKHYFAKWSQKPGVFHAEVYDAASVLADAVVGVAGTDHRARGEVLKRLLDGAPRVGVTGVVAFRGHEAVPRVQVLTVDGELIRARASEDEERFIRGQVRSETP